MKTLIAVQALFAAVLLLLGIVLTFTLGITGLLFLLAGGLFAAMASLADTRSRMAVVVVLAFDAVVAAFAASKLVTL